MAMIKVIGGTTTSTFEEIYDDNTTVAQVLEQKNVSTYGATITANTQPVSDYSKTLKEVARGSNELFLFAIVNSKNA